MEVRLATIKDEEQINSLFDGYSTESLEYYGENMDKDKAKQAVMHMVKSKTCFVGIHEGQTVGGISGVIFPGLFTKDTFFSTLFFYVEPSYRYLTKAFLRQLNGELNKIGVTKLIIGSPEFGEAKKLDRYYKMNGFELLERHYLRKVKNDN